MGTDTCPICNKESSSFCSHCKKTVYCGKEHQKQHWKSHKPQCYPAYLKSHPILGNHLVASRDIGAGETIFKEEPLIVGPRSNLPHFTKICLGCCDQVKEKESSGGSYSCSSCGWPVCDVNCEQNPKHALFECPILAKGKVPPAQTQEEYLCITFLRCILLQTVDPGRWDELLKFESHVEARKGRPNCVEQSHFAIHFIKERCKLQDVESKLIDFVYGIIIVNGYGDPSTFAVKLYSKSAKISHACIPNTRTNGAKGLEVVATTQIKASQPLTQLYGRIFKGTHRRQELLQNIYYFSCSCLRCSDPTELGTYFSAVKCPQKKKCHDGYLLPKNPLDISSSSKWKCNCCNYSGSYLNCIVPALGEINKEAGTDENDGLYSQYEVYDYDNPEVPSTGEHAINEKLIHVVKMLRVLRKLETGIVHKNHYGLLPLKTALIVSIHDLLQKIKDEDIIKGLLNDYLEMVKEMLEVVEILLPGMTSERGFLLFFLSEGLKLSMRNLQGDIRMEMEKQSRQLQSEALKIMMLDSEHDDNRKLVLKYIKR